jgi:hypothetical protein
MSHFYNQTLRILSVAILSICCFFLQAQRTPVQAQSQVSGKIMIKLKPAASTLIAKSLNRLSTNISSSTFSTGMTHFDAVARQLQATRMVRVFPNAGRMEAKQHKYGLDRWYIVQVGQTVAVPSAVNSFRQIAEVEVVQPVYAIKSITSPITKISSGSPVAKPLDGEAPAVNDPFYYLQWHYHNTGQVGGYTGAILISPLPGKSMPANRTSLWMWWMKELTLNTRIWLQYVGKPG